MFLGKKFQGVLAYRLLVDCGRCWRGLRDVDFFVVVADYCCFLLCEVPCVKALESKLKVQNKMFSQ